MSNTGLIGPLVFFLQITVCAKNLQIKLSLQSTEFITEEDQDSAARKRDILERLVLFSENNKKTF